MLEIRVPISPRPFFFKQVELLYRSVRRCGGATADMRMVVSVGDDIEPYDIASTQPWAGDDVVWRWVPREEFQRSSYLATGNDRFLIETDADVVLFADADTIFVRGVDDLLAMLRQTPAVAGVIAHIPPFLNREGETWQSLLNKIGYELPLDLHQHTGWGTMFDNPAVRFAPAYYNFGAVFVSGSIVGRLARAYNAQFPVAKAADVGYFQGQLALMLAIHASDLRRIALQPRYNFPNDPHFERGYPQDLADVRILHYLRTDEINRNAIWDSPQVMAEFLARHDLRPSNEVLRRTVEQLLA